MMNPTASWRRLLMCLVLPAVVTAKINWDTHYDDLPVVRFTEWSALPAAHQAVATTAGYEQGTWNQLSTADMELSSWTELAADTREALDQLGFTPFQWDCYMNHFQAQTWAEIVDRGLDDAAEILGYTEELWTNDGLTATDALTWDNLTDGQGWAAASFCYFSDSWDEIAIPNMLNLPTPYPYFRYRVWVNLSPTERDFAIAVGWTEETWNSPFQSDIESIAFADLGDGERAALLAMGFSEESYDCYVDHYYGYTWEELVQFEIAPYFEEFGWTESLYDADSQPVAWAAGVWSALNDVEKNAADQLCWFQEIWESTPLGDWAGNYYIPAFRYQPWEELTLKQSNMATTVGWTADNWNVPGTAELETVLFADQTPAQQDALRGLGFTHAEQYDCYINHYVGAEWNQLADYGALEGFQALGWTEDAWNENTGPPASDDKAWRELTEAEQEAAGSLCFFLENWDSSPLTYWDGVAFPENRYFPWSTWGPNQQTVFTEIGWTAQTWDIPGQAGFESVSFADLPATQSEALEEFGFYAEQWDCYMAHYEGYDWAELILEGVSENFAAFGWTAESWPLDQAPDTWDLDWGDLTEAQQNAAYEICFFEEIWQGIKLAEWSDETRSGNVFPDDGSVPTSPNGNTPPETPTGTPTGTTPPESPGSDDGSGAGGIVILVLLILCVGGGALVFYKVSKKDKKTFTGNSTLVLEENMAVEEFSTPVEDLPLPVEDHEIM